MLLEAVFFVLFIALVLHNNGVQTYIHFEAYPNFQRVGAQDFTAYLEDYEKRLTVPLLLPYGLTVLTNVALFFSRPEILSFLEVLVLLILNLSVAAVSIFVATPVYNQLKQDEDRNQALDELMRINIARLVISSVVSLIVCANLVAAFN